MTQKSPDILQIGVNKYDNLDLDNFSQQNQNMSHDKDFVENGNMNITTIPSVPTHAKSLQTVTAHASDKDYDKNRQTSDMSTQNQSINSENMFDTYGNKKIDDTFSGQENHLEDWFPQMVSSIPSVQGTFH